MSGVAKSWVTSLDWKQIAALVSTIVTVLVSSGILATTSTQPSNTPNVDVDIAHKYNYTQIRLSNSGTAAATNLTLLLRSPVDIVVHREFSTENLTLIRDEPGSLGFFMPRFVQGTGSIVVIDVTIGAIQAYAVYDQGSSIGKMQSGNPISQASYDLREWLSDPRTLAMLLIIIGISSMIAFLYFWKTRSKRRLGRIKKRVSRVVTEYIAGKMDKEGSVHELESLKYGLRKYWLGAHRISEDEWAVIQKIIDDGINRIKKMDATPDFDIDIAKGGE